MRRQRMYYGGYTLTIEDCKITKVESNGQELKDGDSRVTTTAHITGKLTSRLAKIIAGEDGAKALFGGKTHVGSVTLRREDGAVSVDLFAGNGDQRVLHLTICGAHSFKANAKDKTVSFRISTEANGKEIYDHYRENPLWQGAVEITKQQGTLFEAD